MAPFAGWEMPIQYEGILTEHHHTRRACSIFDTCHMGELVVAGPSAERDLDRLLTLSVATLQAGQCRYGYLLRDDGGVLDDLTCYRLGPTRFMLCVNAGRREADARWIGEHLSPGSVLRDASPDTAKLDVQGPASREAVERAFDVKLPELGYFRFAEIALDGVPCLVSRSGYTGEWGYELYFPASHAVRFWDRLRERGGAKPAGLGARDTLRLEMGYPLYGHELSVERTPAAASRGRFVDLSKDFIGRDAVRRELEQGAREYLVGLRLATRRAARAGDTVRHNGRTVGSVTSGSLAPSLGVAVALAYVESGLDRPGQPLSIEVRGELLPAEVAELPFYKEGTARGRRPSRATGADACGGTD